MTNIEYIHELVSKLGCEVRIGLKDGNDLTAWSNWISEPEKGHIEIFSSGPWPSKEIAWIDINPIASVYIGRLVKNKQIDHTDVIIAGLKSAEITFEIVDNFIRVGWERK